MARVGVDVDVDVKNQRELDRLSRGIDDVDRKAKNAGLSFGKLTGSFTAGNLASDVIRRGIQLLGDGIKTTITRSSSLNEAINKNRVAFGEQADATRDWAKGLTASFGIAELECLQMASTFGLIFNNMGLNVKQSQAWSMNLVELAADLSSIHDIPLDKSLAKIHSGLVGTIEPMRQLGVVLDKQTVAQYAAANGIGKTASELTQQEKVLIRYHLMVQQSAAAQGDFARTSDEVANASRTAKSNLGNLASEVGQKLLPPVKEGLRLFNGLFTSEQEAQAADYRSRVSEIATDMRRWAGADVSEQRIQLESMFKALRETDAQGSFEAWEVFVNNYLRMGDTDLYDSVRSVNALERAHADLITTRDDVSAQATWDERKKKEEEYWEGVEKLYLGVPKLLSEYGAAERDTARDIAALRIAAKDDNVELLDERKRIQREYSTFLQGELGIEKGVADAIATIYLNDQQRMANAADLKIRKQYEVRSELGLVAQAQDTLAYGLHTEAIPAMREFAGSTDEQIEKAQELINKLNEIPLDKRIAITVEVVGMQAAVDQLGPVYRPWRCAAPDRGRDCEGYQARYGNAANAGRRRWWRAWLYPGNTRGRGPGGCAVWYQGGYRRPPRTYGAVASG